MNRPAHATKKIAVKVADIDVVIIPLIKWLNSFHGVTTLFCCEGRDDDLKGDSPYVIFVCVTGWSLMQIMAKFTPFSDRNSCQCTVDFRPNLGYPIRYEMRFKSKEMLLRFIRYVKTGEGLEKDE